jgi:hypothetical protein
MTTRRSSSAAHNAPRLSIGPGLPNTACRDLFQFPLSLSASPLGLRPPKDETVACLLRCVGPFLKEPVKQKRSPFGFFA